MKVAYDWGPLLDPPTGVGRYTHELADALETLGQVELVRYAVALRGRTPERTRRWRAPAQVVRKSWRRLAEPHIERLTGPVDLVHATNFVLPALRDAPGVVTIHDLSFFRDDVFPGGHVLRDLVPWSVSRARRVLVPTNAVAAELVERLRVDPERISVTPEGVAPEFFGATPLAEGNLARLAIPGDYVLALGTVEPRKNLPRLLEAWTAAGIPDLTLVLAGPKGWGPDLPQTSGVVLTGYLDDVTLPGLLAGALFFVYPSLYEGFGLPPLEAMAAGTPVIAGDLPVTREVLGDAALLVDPHDAGQLAEALQNLASDDALRRSLRLQGRARATTYTWPACATLTAEAYRAALA